MCIMEGSLPTFNQQCIHALELRLRSIFKSFESNLEESLNLIMRVESQTLFQVKENSNVNPGEINFIEFLRTNQIFVDKSLFIKEILHIRCPDRLFINRPRRWGKTLNMSMLIEFLRAEVNDEGNIVKYNSNYPLFAWGELTDSQGKPMFIKKLQISTVDNGIYLEQQGQFPVIAITFKSASTNDYGGEKPLYQSMREAISEAFYCHTYIIKIIERKLVTKSSSYDIKNLNLELNKFQGYLNCSPDSSLEYSIYFLSKLLYKYLKAEVYVFVDEYDRPMNSLQFNSPEYKNASILVENMFSNAFKSSSRDRFIAKAILTGIFEFKVYTDGSGINNFDISSFIKPRFPSLFGFTEEEVNDLINEGFVQSPQLELQKNKIKNWYKGYQVDKFSIYNPWSIINCLNRMQINAAGSVNSYWPASGTAVETLATIEELVASQALKQLFLEGKIMHGPLSIAERGIGDGSTKEEDLLRLLLFSGNVTKIRDENMYVPPNLEVKSYFYQNLFPIWLKANLEVSNDSDPLNIAVLLANKLEILKEYIEILDEKLISRLIQYELTESSFYNLLGGIGFYASLVMSSPKHLVYSEIPIKYEKKSDSLFKPVPSSGSAYVIQEYKKLDTGAVVTKVMINAFWKIYSQRYLSPVLQDINPQSKEFIITRVIVFYRSKLDKWSICAKGFKHTLEEAMEIDQIFSSANPGILQSSDILYGVKKTLEREDARKEVLKPYRATNIYQLLRKYSKEEAIKTKKVESESESEKYQKLDFELRSKTNTVKVKNAKGKKPKVKK